MGGLDKPRSPIRTSLSEARHAFIAAALFSGAVNLLMLSGPLFMMQVYDRVLTSRSLETLQALIVLVAILYLFQAVLDLLRSRLFSRIGRKLDEDLGPIVFRAAATASGPGSSPRKSSFPFRDLDHMRGFLSGGGPAALFDLPWMPLYVAVLFLAHPLLGGVDKEDSQII